ncbi:zinc finger and BTB domain-containing protein 14-like [Dreissena polymorpha]|nr:zinc finger and BTB domain-containing protein 14-like [Dreissena polymorpha]
MDSFDSSSRFFHDNKHNSLIFSLLNKQRSVQKLCDVIIQIFDFQFHAHACVLASASPYFNKLFCDADIPREYCEKSPQLIEIHIDTEVSGYHAYSTAIEKIIDFMYTSSISLEDNIVTEIAEVAKIMQLTSIIGFCNLYQQGFIVTQSESLDVSTQTCDQASDIPLIKSCKKRGRPRKQPVENVDETSNNGGNSEKENLNDGDTSVKEVSRIATDEVVEDTPVRVSKRGRVIKPRKFEDEVIDWIKVEKDMSENENETTECFNDGKEIDTNDPIYELHSAVFKDAKNLKYICEHCGYTANKLSEFNEHELEHMVIEGVCLHCYWKCPETDQHKTSLEHLIEHVQTHNTSTEFVCNFCSSKFDSKAKLYQHLPKHSQNRPFVCSLCKASFKWKHALKTHLAVHKSTKDYICNICGYATVHKVQLKEHFLLHTGDMFKCSEPGCDYQTTKKSNLKFHTMVHTKEKPHVCGSCGIRFSLEKNLKRHMLLHNSTRPFQCTLCAFNSTRFDKLKEHYYKTHDIGQKPAKKLRLTDYLKNSGVQLEDHIVDEEPAVQMEMLELQVPECEEGTTQIMNVTSSTGETVPIAITNNGTEISYTIQHFPLQIVSQEIVSQ